MGLEPRSSECHNKIISKDCKLGPTIDTLRTLSHAACPGPPVNEYSAPLAFAT